jgi:hypothetical protein
MESRLGPLIIVEVLLASEVIGAGEVGEAEPKLPCCTSERSASGTA